MVSVVDIVNGQAAFQRPLAGNGGKPAAGAAGNVGVLGGGNLGTVHNGETRSTQFNGMYVELTWWYVAFRCAFLWGLRVLIRIVGTIGSPMCSRSHRGWWSGGGVE